MTVFGRLGFASRSLLQSQSFRTQQFSSYFTTFEFPHNHSFKQLQHMLQTPYTSANRHFHATGICYSTQQDMYQLLGVPKTATRDEIRKAFLALAKKYHPDANKDNPVAKKKFQEIREAYETLRDTEKRAQYDKERAHGASQSQYGPRQPEGFGDAYEDQFSDAFRKIFSEVFEHEAEFAADIQEKLNLSFSEAALGCTRHLSFDARVPCDSCNGIGYPVGAKLKLCPTCRGAGKVTVLPFTTTCSTCRGLGRIIKESCQSCRGRGAMDGVKEVKVTIPSGVESGDTIRVANAGNSGGRGVQPGNLYIKIKVAKDPIFHREGADVYVDSHISFTQAIVGGKVDVPTLSGNMQVKIPKGVQPGQLLILRGRGLSKHGAFLESRGDLYVRFRINLPTSLNERQRTLLEEFAQEEWSTGSSASERNWWQQIVELQQNVVERWQYIVDQFMIQGPLVRFSALLLFLYVLGRIM